MVPHPYMCEMLIATRHAQIRHEMQQIRRQAYVGQRRALIRSGVGSLGTFMIILGSYLQRMGQRSGASFHSS